MNFTGVTLVIALVVLMIDLGLDALLCMPMVVTRTPMIRLWTSD